MKAFRHIFRKLDQIMDGQSMDMKISRNYWYDVFTQRNLHMFC